jgi:hypothetical protein
VFEYLESAAALAGGGAVASWERITFEMDKENTDKKAV